MEDVTLPNQKISFKDVLELVRYLRSPEGCPWDQEQTRESLKPLMLEECYEVIDAINSGNAEEIAEELGDLMLHIAFQIAIAEEKGTFTEHDACDTLIQKMKRRHPHVFGDKKFNSAEEVKAAWEEIKLSEKKQNDHKSILDGLPRSLPPLLRAYNLQRKVARYNFDWSDTSGIYDKIEEELEEVKKAERTTYEELEEEIGDVLFSVVNLSRLLGVHPKNALSKSINKFSSRFRKLEQIAKDEGLVLGEAPLEKLGEIWDRIKESEKD